MLQILVTGQCLTEPTTCSILCMYDSQSQHSMNDIHCIMGLGGNPSFPLHHTNTTSKSMDRDVMRNTTVGP